MVHWNEQFQQVMINLLTYVVNVGDIFELSEEFSIAELYFLEYENTIQQPS